MGEREGLPRVTVSCQEIAEMGGRGWPAGGCRRAPRMEEGGDVRGCSERPENERNKGIERGCRELAIAARI